MIPEPVTLIGLGVLVAATFAGGFTNGLIGFGAGLVAMGWWLQVIEPVMAVPLLSMVTVPAQLMTLKMIWTEVDWLRLSALLGGAAFGAPLGAWVLTQADPDIFRFCLGLGLAAFSGWRLATRRQRAARAAWEPGLGVTGGVGLVASFFGGLSGVTAPAVTLWASVQGWSKDRQRGVYQPFMLGVALIILASYAAQGLITREVGVLALYLVPVILAASLVGAMLYRRLNDSQFETLILTVTLLSGLGLALRAA